MGGKPVTDEQKARMIEMFQEGTSVPQIAAYAKENWGNPSYSWISIFLRDQFGPRGTEERPHPAPPNKKDDVELAPEILEAFKRLETVGAVAEELGHSTKLVKRVLVGAGVEVPNKGRPRKKTPEFFCRVCGELIHAKKCFKGLDGAVVPSRTCGKPECRAAIAFGEVEAPPPVSRKEIRTDKGGWTLTGRQNFKQRENLETLLLAERLDVDMLELRKVLPVAQLGEYHARFELVVDPRGTARPGNQDSIWGDLSRVPVYLRLVSRGEGHAALRLILDEGQTPFDRFTDKFFSDVEHAIAVSKAFRPLLAWRCACPEQTTWTLDTILELPEETGEFGLCSICGACALSIERMT